MAAQESIALPTQVKRRTLFGVAALPIVGVLPQTPSSEFSRLCSDCERKIASLKAFEQIVSKVEAEATRLMTEYQDRLGEMGDALDGKLEAVSEHEPQTAAEREHKERLFDLWRRYCRGERL